MRFSHAVAGVGVVLLAGCRQQPAPLAIPANPESVRALAGTWEGTYGGADARRTGTITLAIRVAGDSAVGEVLMAPPAGARLPRPDDDPASHRRHASSPTRLAVKFVAAAGGEVTGALEPFVPSDCDCTATTIFTARVFGDTISGTFETRGETMATQSGKWRALRKVVIVSSDAPPARN